VFVPCRPFLPNLITVGKTRVSSILTQKHQTRLEWLARDKYYGLLQTFINNGRITFYNVWVSLCPQTMRMFDSYVIRLGRDKRSSLLPRRIGGGDNDEVFFRLAPGHVRCRIFPVWGSWWWRASSPGRSGGTPSSQSPGSPAWPGTTPRRWCRSVAWNRLDRFVKSKLYILMLEK